MQGVSRQCAVETRGEGEELGAAIVSALELREWIKGNIGQIDMHGYAAADRSQIRRVRKHGSRGHHIRFDRCAVQEVLRDSKAGSGAHVEPGEVEIVKGELLGIVADDADLEDVPALVAEVVNIGDAKGPEPIRIRSAEESTIES